MLIREIKYMCCVLVLIVALASCLNEPKPKPKESRLEYPFCQDIYDEIDELLTSWANDSLSYATYYAFHEWELDSLIFYDYKKENIRGKILTKAPSMRTSDALRYFFARKIDQRWRISFINDIFYLNRRNYQYDAYLPMSFEKLSYISHQPIIEKRMNANEFAEYSNRMVTLYLTGYIDYHCKKRIHQENCIDSVIISLRQNPQYYNFDSIKAIHRKTLAKKKINPSLQRKPRKVPWYERLYKRREQRMVLEETDWKSQKIKWIVIDSCK